MLILLVVGTIVGQPEYIGQRHAVLLLGFVPILLALALYFTIGMARLWLNWGMRGKPWLWGTALLGACLATFGALGCSLIGFVQLIVVLGGPPIVSLSLVFADQTVYGALLNDPTQYLWLIGTLSLCLLPAFGNLVLVLLGNFTTGPIVLRHWMANELATANRCKGRARYMGHAVFAATVATAITGAAMICWYGGLAVIWLFPNTGPMIVQLFAAWARLIGAI